MILIKFWGVYFFETDKLKYKYLQQSIPLSIWCLYCYSIFRRASKCAVGLKKATAGIYIEQTCSIITDGCNTVCDLSKLRTGVGIGCSYRDQIAWTAAKVVESVSALWERCLVGCCWEHRRIVIGVFDVDRQGESGAALLSRGCLPYSNLLEKLRFTFYH